MNLKHCGVLIALLLASYSARAQPDDCLSMDKETEVKVRVIVLDALDQALKDHVAHVFHIWRAVDDSASRLRARQGTRSAIIAYARAREAILKMQWSCPR